jgi:ABC-2 type transport system permease protein
MSAIRTAGLSKRYGGTLALDSLDLVVDEGEVYGYLGPNGAGKTTTIRLLLGLHRPSGGRAELFGVDAWSDPVATTARPGMAAGSGRPANAPDRRATSALARRAIRDARTRTLVFAGLFALYACIQPAGYRAAYPTSTDRLAFAASFADNLGLRLFYGEPHDLLSVGGYTAWRVGGTLAIAAAVFGLLAAVRAMRAEEDSGRMEAVLAAPVGRRTAFGAAIAAVAAGTCVLWLAELAGLLAGGLPAGGSAFLALATASVVPVCAGVGAVASQLAPNRRVALQLGLGVVALFFVLRVVADTAGGAGWLRWATPLGWRRRCARSRAPGRSSCCLRSSPPHCCWPPLRVSTRAATATGYLGFVFVFFILAVNLFAVAQVGAARHVEAEQQLETLLALPVGRARWLGGRLLLAAGGAAAISAVAGLLTWAGATAAGVGVSLPRMLEAGANCLPVALLFLGVAALAYAVVPRASGAIAYGLVTVTFLWQLVGSLLSAPSWLVDLTPFAHVGLVPAQPFHAAPAVAMLAIGAASASLAVVAFRRRDLLGA